MAVDPSLSDWVRTWIHGIGKNNGPRNPIYQFALKDNLETSPFAERNITAYDGNGSHFNVSRLYEEFKEALSNADDPIYADEKTGEKEISIRGALRRAGWSPDGDPEAQAAEVFGFDLSCAVSPDVVTTFVRRLEEDV